MPSSGVVRFLTDEDSVLQMATAASPAEVDSLKGDLFLHIFSAYEMAETQEQGIANIVGALVECLSDIGIAACTDIPAHREYSIYVASAVLACSKAKLSNPEQYEAHYSPRRQHAEEHEVPY